MRASLRSRIRDRIPQPAFWRSVKVVASGAAFAQALSLLAAPILTRLYSPADYGILAVYLAVVAVLLVVSTVRYELAIPLPESDDDAAQLLAFGLGVAVAVSVALALALALGAGDLLAGTGAAALMPYAWFVPIALLAAAIYQCMTYWAVRQRTFTVIARTRMTQGIGRTGTQLALGAIGAGPLGLMLGDAIGRGGGSGMLVRAARRGNWSAISSIRIAGARRLAHRYRRFAALSSVSALLEVGARQLPALLLALSFPIDVVGWYSLAQQVIFLPIGLIAQAVTQVYAGEAPRAAREGGASLRRVFLKTAGGLALMALVPTILLAWLAPLAFSLVFGEIWTEAGVYARLLAPVFFFTFVLAPLTYTLNVLGALNVLLLWSVLRFAAVLAALLVVPLLGGSPALTLVAYSGAMAVAYAALFVLCLWQIRVQPPPDAAAEDA